MNRVVQNQNQGPKSQDQVAKELQALEQQLMSAAKQAQSTTELMEIESALDKIQQAKAVTAAPMAAQAQASRARVGQARVQQPAITPQTKLEQNIQAIKSVQGEKLQPGDVFSSYNTFGNSNTKFMRTNINGLFDLMDSKNKKAA